MRIGVKMGYCVYLFVCVHGWVENCVCVYVGV